MRLLQPFLHIALAMFVCGDAFVRGGEEGDGLRGMISIFPSTEETVINDVGDIVGETVDHEPSGGETFDADPSCPESCIDRAMTKYEACLEEVGDESECASNADAILQSCVCEGEPLLPPSEGGEQDHEGEFDLEKKQEEFGEKGYEEGGGSFWSDALQPDEIGYSSPTKATMGKECFVVVAMGVDKRSGPNQSTPKDRAVAGMLRKAYLAHGYNVHTYVTVNNKFPVIGGMRKVKNAYRTNEWTLNEFVFHFTGHGFSSDHITFWNFANDGKLYENDPRYFSYWYHKPLGMLVGAVFFGKEFANTNFRFALDACQQNGAPGVKTGLTGKNVRPNAKGVIVTSTNDKVWCGLNGPDDVTYASSFAGYLSKANAKVDQFVNAHDAARKKVPAQKAPPAIVF